MLPVLLLVLPPSIAGGGYACWFLGHQTAHSFLSDGSNKPATPLINSGASYATAVGAFAGVYGALSTQFPRHQETGEGKDLAKTKQKASVSVSESKKSFVPPHKKAQSEQFQPPKTIAEAFRRYGRPMVFRAGAVGVAFFCAGTLQTVVANKNAGKGSP
mmetsp:Transcript_22388/g.33128  ORF Transcript_22388/g.33128 Transcript_22388/m.33128 type:complete len:159 (+) Transcript_22388:181-657(+)